MASLAFVAAALLPETTAEQKKTDDSDTPFCDYQAFDFHWPGSPALVTVHQTDDINTLAPEWLNPIRSGAFLWNNVSTKFEYRDGISIIDTDFNVLDGYNVVDIASTFGYGDAIAVTQIVDWDGDTGELIEVDIAYGFDWYFPTNQFATSCVSNKIDVRSAAIHEFGHMLGLDDCTFCSPQSVMKLKTNFETCYTALSQSDKDCVNAIYPQGTPPGGGGGCKRGTLPTVAMVPEGMRQDFLRLLAYHPDLDEAAAHQLANVHLSELRQIAETHQPATRAVNTFITAHLDFVQSQNASSPQTLSQDVIADVKTLFRRLAQSASPSLRQQLMRLERSFETGAGKTFKQMVDDVLAGKVDVGEPSADEPVPEAFELVGNFPNPFNPSTVIQYRLPEATHVTLEVFDATGRLVRTLVDKEQGAGTHDVVFEAADLPSGTYLYQINTAQGTRSGKMTLVR